MTITSRRISDQKTCRDLDEDDPDPPFGDFADELTLPVDDADVSEPGGIVVVRSVGNPGTGEGKRILAAFACLLGRGLPSIAVPDLAETRRALVSIYPHSATVIDAVLADLIGQVHVRLPPTILVGSPGSGKTSLALDLLEALGVPSVVYACPAIADNSLVGTPRRWTTAEPSLPVSLIAAHQVASPGIVLDEIEKAASGNLNGQVHDALLSLLEPRSAAAWLDPYLQSAVDLSHVIWLGTANTLEGVPRALRERCRILAFPPPGREHIEALAPAILKRACRRRGLDERWATDLDGTELRAVRTAWTGGSLRHLARLLDGVLAARDMAPRLN